MLATREVPQHPGRVGVVTWLPQDRAVEQDERVGGQDPVVGVARGPCRGLLPREAAGGLLSRLAGHESFVDVGRRDLERNAERGQDLDAARRGGGEDETGHRPVILERLSF
jgi:hypothetical protein